MDSAYLDVETNRAVLFKCIVEKLPHCVYSGQPLFENLNKVDLIFSQKGDWKFREDIDFHVHGRGRKKTVILPPLPHSLGTFRTLFVNFRQKFVFKAKNTHFPKLRTLAPAPPPYL